MQDLTTNNAFQEFDAFSLKNMNSKAEGAFEGWVPFNDIKVDVEVTKSEALRQRELDLEEKMKMLEAKEEALAQEKVLLTEQASVVQKLLSEFESIKKNHWENNLREIIDFCTAMAEKIVVAKIIEDPTVLINQIKVAIETSKSVMPVEINLSPEDVQALELSNNSEVKSFYTHKDITWIANRRLTRGQVYIDTNNYRLDASVLSVLDNIKLELVNGIEDERIKSEFESKE